MTRKCSKCGVAVKDAICKKCGSTDSYEPIAVVVGTVVVIMLILIAINL